MIVLPEIPFGWSLDYRRSFGGWLAPFRFRILPNKNERADYRITEYGKTASEAMGKAMSRMREQQQHNDV